MTKTYIRDSCSRMLDDSLCKDVFLGKIVELQLENILSCK